MKKFLLSFLGTLAGLWVTITLCLLGLILMIAGAVSSSVTPVVVDNNSVLYLDMRGNISEYIEPVDFMATLSGEMTSSIPLCDIVRAIDEAADDERIKGIFIDCNDAGAGIAQRQAIIDALQRFKKSGKWIYSYGDTYSQGDYYVAANAADSLFVNPSGVIDIHGLSAMTMFYKGLLDKIGVNIQVVKVGTYKSAVEPFLYTSPSPASVEQQQLFLSNIWNNMAASIAKGRKVSADSVNAWADSQCWTAGARSYLSRHIADALRYRHQVISLMKELTDRDEDDDLRLVTPVEYVKAIGQAKRKDRARIAVLYASGDIVDEGKTGIVGATLVPQILDLAREDDIDGLVLRVNSGGGSAFASEQIWEALEQFKKISGKPFYVSMSDYAASGGYYISCGADRIYAMPGTLTGSIGIFGIIPDASGLMNEKLGLTEAVVSTNPEGEIPSIFRPMTETQRHSLQASVDRGYELFVKRVADGRKMPVSRVKEIAEGRVWDGSEALKIKLVDKIGGLETALADMAAELGDEGYVIVPYPEIQNNFMQMLMSMQTDMESRALREKLGKEIKFFEVIEMLRTMDNVQARMETVELR